MQVARCFWCYTVPRRRFWYFAETAVCVSALICGVSGGCVNGERFVSFEESQDGVKDVLLAGREVSGEACARWWRAPPSAGSSCRLPPRSRPPSAAPGYEPWLQPPAPCRNLVSRSKAATCVLARAHLLHKHHHNPPWTSAELGPYRCRGEPACQHSAPERSGQQERAWGYAALHFQELPSSHGRHKRKGKEERKGKAHKRRMNTNTEGPTTIRKKGCYN